MIYKTITQLSDAIQSGEITPTELTQISLERLREYGPVLNCVVTITKERAQKQAKLAEKEVKLGEIINIHSNILIMISAILHPNIRFSSGGSEAH